MANPSDFLKPAHKRIRRLRRMAADARAEGMIESEIAYRRAAARLETSMQDCIRARLEHVNGVLRGGN